MTGLAHWTQMGGGGPDPWAEVCSQRLSLNCKGEDAAEGVTQPLVYPLFQPSSLIKPS